MATVTKYPQNIQYEQVEKTRGYYTETIWNSLDRLKKDDTNYAYTNTVASRAGTKSKPGRIKATTFNFDIPINSKINSVKVEWKEYARASNGSIYGTIAIPSVSIYLIKANGGSNSSTKTDNYRVPTSPTSRSLTWTSSDIPNVKRDNLADSGFGVYFNPARNTNYNAGIMYLDYIRVVVDYTTPTYSLYSNKTGTLEIFKDITVTATLTNSNNTPHTTPVPVNVSIPSDATVKSVTCDGTYNFDEKFWNAKIGSGGTATITMVLTFNQPGSKTVSFTETVTNQSTSQNFNVTDTYLKFTHVDYSVIGTSNTTITYTATKATSGTATATIPLPSWITYVSYSGDGTYNPSTGEWSVSFASGGETKTLNLTIRANATNKIYKQVVTSNSETATIRYLINGTPSNTTCLGYRINLNAAGITLTQNKTYHLTFYMYAEKKGIPYKQTGVSTEYKVFIDSTEIGDIPLDIYDGWQKVDIEFTAPSSSPNYLYINGPSRYSETEKFKLMLAGLCIAKDSEFYEPKTLISNPERIGVQGQYATISLSAYEETNIYKVKFQGTTPSDGYVVGMEIPTEYETDNNLSGDLILHFSDYDIEKTSIFPPEATKVAWGSKWDKWGLEELDDSTSPLFLPLSENPYMLFKLKNISSETANVKLKNITFDLYYVDDSLLSRPGFKLDNVHSKSYLIHLSPDTEFTAGIDPNIQITDYKQADENILYGYSVNPKKLSLKFYIGDDDFEGATDLLEEVTKFFSNKKDKFGLPIPKKLRFDWDDDTYYNVILSSAIKSKAQPAAYECQAEFVIPDGVGWHNPKYYPQKGKHRSILPAKPLICLRTVGKEIVTITESKTGQKMIINSKFPNGTILYVDCKLRKVYDSNNTEYTGSVALNSDWFRLNPEFDFSDSNGCEILFVKVVEAV
ncbi:MAG TPA: hypothetical protein PKU94_07735 [Candidatus Hydrothermia bacterium]|nr:hypothetical protein [Candidatus Hydrothermia bacterium]